MLHLEDSESTYYKRGGISNEKKKTDDYACSSACSSNARYRMWSRYRS